MFPVALRATRTGMPSSLPAHPSAASRYKQRGARLTRRLCHTRLGAPSVCVQWPLRPYLLTRCRPAGLFGAPLLRPGGIQLPPD